MALHHKGHYLLVWPCNAKQLPACKGQPGRAAAEYPTSRFQRQRRITSYTTASTRVLHTTLCAEKHSTTRRVQLPLLESLPVRLLVSSNRFRHLSRPACFAWARFQPLSPMKRIFGTKKEKPKPPTLDEATGRLDSRGNV